MCKNRSLKTRLKKGETLYGIFFEELRSNYFSMFLENAGYDFGIIDLEHCHYSWVELGNMLPCFHHSNVSAIVRVPEIRKECFQIPMDLGVAGIMVPNVESAEEARRCVEWMSYPPRGKRGIATCRPHTRFINENFQQLCPQANDEKLLVIQIESRQGLEHLEEILAVEGIDVVFVGNADLSISMGVPNTLEAGSELRKAQEKILQTAMQHGIVGGGNVGNPKIIRELQPLGMRLVTLLSDVEIFHKGLGDALHTVKGGLA
ncbi:MAG: aldolase/citrate lyase family protein [Planctomycetia bacterium]|nr:aldolase/citrate lyase family protein [Planctomycetia bacterium]